ncbi:MAG: glucosaminidase domain-containing protein [Candidatus Hydrothermales bacterium]
MIWLLIFMLILILFLIIGPEKKSLKEPEIIKPFQFASSKDEFIKKFMPYAVKIASKYDMDPKIILTHAAHETGWGKKVIDLNFFGIKATSKWKEAGKDTIFIWTTEYEDGKEKKKIDEFKKYNSIEEAIEDYINLIQNVYPEAWKNRKNYKKYFEALIKYEKKYATDPLYSQKLKNVYESIT